MSMFNDNSCGTKDNERECVANANVVSIYAKKFGKGHWSFIGPGSEKKWYSMEEDKRKFHKESGIISRKRCCWNLPKADVRFSVQRLHCPEVNSEAKDMEKLSIHFAADQTTIETIFRTIVCANQLSLFRAVANMCEEHGSLHDRSRQPDVLMGRSIVLSEIKTEVLLENDDPAYQYFVLQQYGERIERLSQQDKVSKFCMDAGFLSVVEIGQYFILKTMENNFMQWLVVNTLFQEMMDHDNQEDGYRETQKLDPCWKLRPVACMGNKESRLEFGL